MQTLSQLMESLEEDFFLFGLPEGTKHHFRNRYRQAFTELIKEIKLEEKGHSSIVQLDVVSQGTKEGQMHYQKEYGKKEGYNQAVSDLDTIKLEILN